MRRHQILLAIARLFRRSAITVTIVFGACGLTVNAQDMSPGHTDERGSTLIDPPRPVDGFSLTHHSGETLTDKRLQGRWDVLYFGYTFCPDVCPVALSALKGVVQGLAQRGWNNDSWAVWLVSVDPKRDTPERLGEYVRHFDAAFNGATGERAAIDHLADQMAVRYRIEPHEPDDRYYVVSHTSTFAIVDPDGALVAVLDDTAPPDELADQLDKLRDTYAARQSRE